MAEAINYRMNLVIDPKNVIKANRELRAMERYFERIQGRVLKIGRTRMVPEIVLKDSASKGLDSLLAKLSRVKSQVINTSANLNLNVKQSSGGQADFSAVTQALQTNTDALVALTGALGTMGALGATKEANPKNPKTIWDKVKDGFGTAKSIGGGVKNLAEIPEKVRAIGDAWKGNEAGCQCCCGGVAVGGRRRGSIAKGSKKRTGKRAGASGKGSKNDPGYVKPGTQSRLERGRERRVQSRGRLGRTAGAAGALLETIGGAGEGLIGGIQGIGKWFGGKSDKTSAVSDASKDVKNGSSGIVANTAKGLGKRLLGPLSFAADAASIATAAPGKERAKAIGSTVLGGAGAAVGGFFGSIIPGAGTLVGSTLGGAAGSWIGEKAGALVADAGNKIKEGVSKVSDWFSSKFSFGKKKKPAEEPAVTPTLARKPASVAVPPAVPGISKGAAAAASVPYIPQSVPPAGFVPPPYHGPVVPYGPIPPAMMALPPSSGTRMGPAVNGSPNADGKNKMTPQIVQISPEQMTALSGYLKDFKTETTMNYNLPPGAVQVTVHEEYPVDVEGLILQIGQRLRAEFARAAQNRKPVPRAYV